jgi:hypothetical protein
MTEPPAAADELLLATETTGWVCGTELVVESTVVAMARP